MSLLSECEKTENSSTAFFKGKITSLDPPNKKADVIHTLEGGEIETKTVSYATLFLTNDSSAQGFNDMVDMENLNEAELLYNIQRRYEKNAIFTYVGPTLLVVNPYQKIPELVTPETLYNYQKKVYEATYNIKDSNPHVYAIGAQCIRKLCETKKNQAIVISGESGAGKTENTKMAMKFITSIGKFTQRKLY